MISLQARHQATTQGFGSDPVQFNSWRNQLEGSPQLPFVPFMKRRGESPVEPQSDGESTGVNRKDDCDVTSDSLTSPSRSDSFKSFQPLSSSLSSSSSSGSPKSSEEATPSGRGRKRALFTIDAILSGDNFSIKGVSQLTGERPAKVGRTAGPPPAPESGTPRLLLPGYVTPGGFPSGPYMFPSPVAPSSGHHAFLHNYYQRMAPSGVSPPAPFAGGFPTPPLTPNLSWNYASPVVAKSIGQSPSPIQHIPVTTEERHLPEAGSPTSKTEKGKRIRTIFTSEQLDRLEREFEKQHYMVGTERYFLARQLNLNEAQVKVWFQNRRIKWRKQKQQSPNNNKPTRSASSQSHFNLLCEQANSTNYR